MGIFNEPIVKSAVVHLKDQLKVCFGESSSAFVIQIYEFALIIYTIPSIHKMNAHLQLSYCLFTTIDGGAFALKSLVDKNHPHYELVRGIY